MRGSKKLMPYRKQLPLLLSLFLLALPFVITHAAGGQLTGIVTDPKGAVVVGASVTAVAAAGDRKFTATTDDEGRYKFASLPPGVYLISVKAPGFSEARREGVQVAEDKAATLDVKLEIAPIEGLVPVSASGTKANSDSVYMQLRQKSASQDAFSGSVATVNNLVLKRDAATFTLRSGELYFLGAIEGRNVGAVFIGDGELGLVPPTDVEKHSINVFTKEPGLHEQFTSLVLRFTDRTFEEIKQSPNAQMATGGAQSGRARELYRDKETLARKELRTNLDLRTLADLYAPERPGFFIAFINGKRFGKLIYDVDPLGIPEVAPEEVALISYGESDGGIWTAFHLAEEYRQGTATSSQDTRVFDITHHKIDGTIRGTKLLASDHVTFRSLVAGSRVLPFNLYRTLRVKSVQDEQNRELSFIQESKDEDADFAVIFPQALEKGREYKLLVQYEGEGAIQDSGGGNYILNPVARHTWYPNNGGVQFGDRATFEMTFRYPKGNMFVGIGALDGAETQDGDTKVSKWTSGRTELAVAGFNYGKFKKKELSDADTGLALEFYANEEVPDELKELQIYLDRLQTQGVMTGTTLSSISTSSMGGVALNDTQNATRIYSAYFGKLPYTRIAMTQQPAGFFGQAWPTLVFMPYLAFIDGTQRMQLFGARGGTDNFWRYVGPHEVAHQWWGHMVGWNSYHDQWMSEGFAEFSTSLYVQYVRKDLTKFNDYWEEQRKRIVDATEATKGIKPYTIGPVTQGYRLSNSKTRAAYQYLVYPKGAYILHMIRMMMFDHRGGGDAKFREMMTDFVKTHYNKDISTEDFKAAVEKHMLPAMNVDKNGRMDWFFNEWVYGTEMPSYRLDYSLKPGPEGKTLLTAHVTQSGVSNDFVMLVPIYADFGKGWTRLGSAVIVGNSTVDLTDVPLPQSPKRVTLCALNDVLAASVDVNKR
jgi:Carboxypeptidase regulatory-like domain/Peptidase family M1 domain